MQFDNPPAGREVTGRCQMCPFFLRPLQTTRYPGVFLPLTNTVQGTGCGMDQARLGNTHCSSRQGGCEIMGRGAPGDDTAVRRE